MACSCSSGIPDYEKKFAVKRLAYTMRQTIIKLVRDGKSGHPGGSLSAADILAVLFFGDVMEYNKENPLDHTQDRFFLSKGHAAPALYAVYHTLGWIDDSDLSTLRQLGTKLQGHPDCHALPGVEICSGSLGQGLSVATGCALGLKLDAQKAGTPAHKVYVVLGDGEMQEGSNWEALMFAAHNNIDNLVGILDLNNLQIDGHVTDVCTLGDIDAKLKAFGWEVIHTSGHCINRLKHAFNQAKTHSGSPIMIVCDTIKGKGVSFMEDQAGWHGKAPSPEEAEKALAELQEQLDRIKEVSGE